MKEISLFLFVECAVDVVHVTGKVTCHVSWCYFKFSV